MASATEFLRLRPGRAGAPSHALGHSALNDPTLASQARLGA